MARPMSPPAWHLPGCGPEAATYQGPFSLHTTCSFSTSSPTPAPSSMFSIFFSRLFLSQPSPQQRDEAKTEGGLKECAHEKPWEGLGAVEGRP